MVLKIPPTYIKSWSSKSLPPTSKSWSSKIPHLPRPASRDAACRVRIRPFPLYAMASSVLRPLLTILLSIFHLVGCDVCCLFRGRGLGLFLLLRCKVKQKKRHGAYSALFFFPPSFLRPFSPPSSSFCILFPSSFFLSFFFLPPPPFPFFPSFFFSSRSRSRLRPHHLNLPSASGI